MIREQRRHTEVAHPRHILHHEGRVRHKCEPCGRFETGRDCDVAHRAVPPTDARAQKKCVVIGQELEDVDELDGRDAGDAIDGCP